MAEELNRSLTMLAERGEPRGAAQVLEAARADVADRSAAARPTWRRGLVLAAGTAGVVLVLIGAVVFLVRPLEGEETPPATVGPPVVTTAPAPFDVSQHPLNQVEAVAVAPDGHLWAATGGGVVRWDLTTGTPTVFGATDGVPSSEVMAIAVAVDGTVWAAGDGWIARYDGSWQMFSQANTPLLDSQITAVAVDESGVVWVDVGSEAPLRYDGTWTQAAEPPSGLWPDGAGVIVDGDGTVWTRGAFGITGFDGTDTTTLVVPPELATRRVPALTLTSAATEEPVLVSTSIGDIEFTTMQVPVGHTFLGAAATPYGPVATERFDVLRWSRDAVTWEGVLPAVDPWRLITDGDDVIVHGDGYVRYAWDGTAWTEVAIVDLPGSARHLAFGPGGAVAVVDGTVFYAADRVSFVAAEAGPDRNLVTTGNRYCVENGPSSSTDPPQMRIGPALATEAGFVVLAPAHPDNWGRTPLCEPLVWFSTDGNTWELASSRSPFGEGAIVHRVAQHDGRFVAVGAAPAESNEGAVWVSTDAVTWQRASVTMLEAVGVAGGDLGWVVTGSAPDSYREGPGVDMWFSPDGLTWDGPYAGPEALATFYFLPELSVGTDTIVGVGGGHESVVVGRLQE